MNFITDFFSYEIDDEGIEICENTPNKIHTFLDNILDGYKRKRNRY